MNPSFVESKLLLNLSFVYPKLHTGTCPFTPSLIVKEKCTSVNFCVPLYLTQNHKQKISFAPRTPANRDKLFSPHLSFVFIENIYY